MAGATGVRGQTGVAGATGIQGQTEPGVALDVIAFNQAVVAVGSGIDQLATMPRFGTIIDVIMSEANQGTVGTTICDVNIGTGTLSTTPYAVQFGTIFTTAANRPIIGAALSPTNQARNTATPDITAFKKGDVLSMDVPQAAAGALGLRIEVIVQFTGA